MDKKGLIRKKYFQIRKKRYFEINVNYFDPFVKLIKKLKIKNSNISIYQPNLYEVDIMKIISVESLKKFSFLLPVIEENGSMNFFRWKKNDVLFVNKYGILEPSKTKKIIPSIIMLPLLAFDKNKNRLGYGKGFYDKFLRKHVKNNKKILTIGVAFSFQKYNNLPINNRDFKLDYIITEKGIL